MNATGRRALVAGGLSIALVAFVARSILAQPKMEPAALSTNWVGYLVIGKVPQLDPIAGRKPFPEADQKVQIGLRSDGGLVWRNALSE